MRQNGIHVLLNFVIGNAACSNGGLGSRRRRCPGYMEKRHPSPDGNRLATNGTEQNEILSAPKLRRRGPGASNIAADLRDRVPGTGPISSGNERKTMTDEPERIPPCLIRIDKEGRWYHKGVEMIRRDFIELFSRNLSRDSEGRYVIIWEGKPCLLEVEDTPFVVWGVTFEQEEGKERMLLELNDGTREACSPETLWVSGDNVLYCIVKEGAFPARFHRPAYYQAAMRIQEENGNFFLPLNGVKYPVVEKPGSVH